MKPKRPATMGDDEGEAVILLRVAQGLDPHELMDLLYGVAVELHAEGVPSAEIDIACASLCERLGFNRSHFLN